MRRQVFIRAVAALGVLSVVSGAGPARADETDRCVSDAEQAQRFRRDARLRSARASLLGCAREACPLLVRTDCKRWLGEVDAALPTVVLRCSDDHGSEIVDVRVLVDGAVLVERIDGRAVAVDPGDHAIRYERGGKTVGEQHVVIQQGEHDRLVSMIFRTPGTQTQASERSTTTVPWVIGGVGAVLTAGGAYLWIRGLGDRSNLYSGCGVTQSCNPSDVDAAKTKVLVGDVLVASGVLTMGVAAAWLLMGPKKTPVARVEARPTAGGAVFVYRASF